MKKIAFIIGASLLLTSCFWGNNNPPKTEENNTNTETTNSHTTVDSNTSDNNSQEQDNLAKELENRPPREDIPAPYFSDTQFVKRTVDGKVEVEPLYKEVAALNTAMSDLWKKQVETQKIDYMAEFKKLLNEVYDLNKEFAIEQARLHLGKEDVKVEETAEGVNIEGLLLKKPVVRDLPKYQQWTSKGIYGTDIPRTSYEYRIPFYIDDTDGIKGISTFDIYVLYDDLSLTFSNIYVRYIDIGNPPVSLDIVKAFNAEGYKKLTSVNVYKLLSETQNKDFLDNLKKTDAFAYQVLTAIRNDYIIQAEFPEYRMTDNIPKSLKDEIIELQKQKAEILTEMKNFKTLKENKKKNESSSNTITQNPNITPSDTGITLSTTSGSTK